MYNEFKNVSKISFMHVHLVENLMVNPLLCITMIVNRIPLLLYLKPLLLYLKPLLLYTIRCDNLFVQVSDTTKDYLVIIMLSLYTIMQ